MAIGALLCHLKQAERATRDKAESACFEYRLPRSGKGSGCHAGDLIGAHSICRLNTPGMEAGHAVHNEGYLGVKRNINSKDGRSAHKTSGIRGGALQSEVRSFLLCLPWK